jgi:hypothetical protein
MIFGGLQDSGRKGAAWVFVLNSSGWFQQGNKLVGSGGISDNYQGCSVALNADGNIALIGGNVDNGLRGAVWFFVRNGSTWSQQGDKLVGSAVLSGSRFGSSVGLSADGNTAVIGGAGDSSNKGAMWVYKRNASLWSQQGAKLTGTGFIGTPRQGTSVAVSATGTTALTGGPNDSTNKGAFWIYVAGTQMLSEESEMREEGMRDINSAFTLFQNSPNPFTNQTSVGFTLPEPCTAEWQIADMSGRVVLALKREYPAGENRESFELKGYNGVYWYTIKTPFGTKTRKMIIIN